ncbi:HD domain-containing protein [Candidatus Peregrinibacteria bacterium]|nr:HD domain-containing protein [Candidatus Peregrinibacteria bacterium]
MELLGNKTIFGVTKPSLSAEETEALNARLDRIFERIPDPHGVITQNVRDEAGRLIAKTEAAREQMGFRPYAPAHEEVLSREFVSTIDAHKDHRRDGDNSLYYKHLLGTCENLVDDEGITGVTTLVAGLHHDDVEDLGKDPAHLVQSPEEYLRGTGIKRLPGDLKKIQERVALLVSGVTKIRSQERTMTDALTFQHFLTTIRDTTARVIPLKLADRTNNMSSLDGLKRERALRICRETENWYVPLAYIFGVRRTLRRLVDYCVQFDNPALFAEFSKLLDERLLQHITTIIEDVETHFDPNVISDVDTKKFVSQNIAGISIVPSSLADFVLTAKKPFGEIALDDLRVSPLDPMHEIVVITKPVDIKNEKDKHTAEVAIQREIAGYIMRCLDKYGRVEIDIPREDRPPKKGAIVKVHSRSDHGKILTFKIIDSVSASRAKRGVLADFDAEASPDMKAKIDRILHESRGDPVRVFQTAQEHLLRPTVKIYTPKGRLVELPIGSTVLDFTAAIHSDFLIGLKKARFSHHVFDKRFEDIGIFDELPDDIVVEFETCAVSNVDPGWLRFCKTENARNVLRKKYLYKQSPEQALESGANHLHDISILFGMDEKAILGILRNGNKPKSQEEQLVMQIGRGKVNVIRVLAERFFGKTKKWYVSVILPNVPGALNEFTGEFTGQAINIDKILGHKKDVLVHHFASSKVQPEDSNEKGMDMLTVQVSDAAESKSPYDMMKILFKLSYRYHMSVSTTDPSMPISG